MDTPDRRYGIAAALLPILEKVPVISSYAKTHGWHYVIGWLHRITGIGLIIGLIVHMDTLSAMQTAGAFAAGLKNTTVWPLFGFLAGASCLGVSFHAMNGGRLILYELYGIRNEARMMRLTFGISIASVALFGLAAVLNIHAIVPPFCWWIAFLGGLAAAYAVMSRMKNNRHTLLWKLQRISGAFLFITVPAYLVFLFLHGGFAVPVRFAAPWGPDLSVRIISLVIALSALYHGGYGLFSIAADYIPSGTVQTGMVTLIVVVMIVLAFLAFRLTLLM